MTMKNRYAKRSKISEPKFRQLVRLFALNLEATQIAELTALNRNTVNRFLRAIRERLTTFCEQQSPLAGEIEVDESFFGPRRVKEKRGRGAYGKTIVFGVFKRNGKVYTEIVPDCSKATLQAIIRGKVEPKASSIPTAGVVTMALSMLAMASISAWIMAVTNSPGEKPISTASRASGVLRNLVSHGSEVLARQPFSCTSKSVSLDSIIVTRICIG